MKKDSWGNLRALASSSIAVDCAQPIVFFFYNTSRAQQKKVYVRFDEPAIMLERVEKLDREKSGGA